MSSSARPIRKQPSRHSIGRSPFSNSYLSGSFLPGSPLAQESIARDLEECDDDDEVETPESGSVSSEDDSSEASTVRPEAVQHSMANSYRRPSFVAFGGTRGAVTPQVSRLFTAFLEGFLKMGIRILGIISVQLLIQVHCGRSH